MLIKHTMSGSAGFLDLAIVPIKTMLGNGTDTQHPPQNGGARKIALIEESGGVSVEKLLFSGAAPAAELKVLEMIKAGRKLLLEGFLLEEVAAWCFTHNYRWRFGLAEGEAQYGALEERLAQGPVITVPTITLEGDANGAPHPDPSSYAGKFSGSYSHRTIQGGVGHNLPQEAPEAFAAAVLEVGSAR